MKSVVYTKIVKDFDGRDFELHLCKHSDARYDVYASVKCSGIKCHVIGGYISDLEDWIEGQDWWVAIKIYMDETGIFDEVFTNDRVLEQYWNVI